MGCVKFMPTDTLAGLAYWLGTTFPTSQNGFDSRIPLFMSTILGIVVILLIIHVVLDNNR